MQWKHGFCAYLKLKSCICASLLTAHFSLIMLQVWNGMICLLFILYCTVGHLGFMWSLNWQRNESKSACWGAKNLLSKLLLARMTTFVCRYHVAWLVFHSWNTVNQQNVLLRSSTPHSTLLVGLGRIRWSFLLGPGRTGLFIWSSLFPVTMLRFTGRKAHWKELHSLRCLSCASAKAPITLLVSWCS